MGPAAVPRRPSFGWFAYAPMGGEAYRSSVAVVVDEDPAAAGPDDR